MTQSDRHIGSINAPPASTRGHPWLWMITARVPQSMHDRGYAASREQAMADFKARWLGNDHAATTTNSLTAHAERAIGSLDLDVTLAL
jgi:hypothetical protein